MNVFIPALGTQLKLTEPWTFNVHEEGRNLGLLKHIGRADNRPFWPKSNTIWNHTFDAGTVLRVERIYIRQNLSSFDSVTFRLIGVKGVRFWVKLADANNIRCEVVTDGEGLR